MLDAQEDSLSDRIEDADSGWTTPESGDFLPDLPEGSDGCQTITMMFIGKEVTFPDADACDKLGELKDALAWAFGVGTLFFLFYLVVSIRTPQRQF